MVDESPQAPGWDSIDAAFRAVHGDVEVDYRAPPLSEQPPADGGVLNGISAYRAPDHWHFVTYGLTDLFAKTEGDPPGMSGFGHELTLTAALSDRAPDWGYDILMGAAKTCVTHGRPFHAGARLAPGASLDGKTSALVAIGLRADPWVTPTVFPFGKFVFLQAVGITDVEYRLMQRASTLMVLERMAVRDPLLLTDPARA